MTRDFFLQPTLQVAKNLLGTFLVSTSNEGVTVGRIVETEAYLGSDDPAAHSYRGETSRNKVMFGEPGHAYVYFIYGMHVCVNAVCGPVGTGHGVLIRALEPIDGIDLMKRRRGKSNLYHLCSGPGKLTQALGIKLEDNGKDLIEGTSLKLLDSFKGKVSQISQKEISRSGRVGIKEATLLPYRFYIKNSPYISRK